ncbi:MULTISPECIES: hypothetical protein [Acinetobacter]|uniref:hypothetical protein n=1 Tax=Acinetobacter TaxID=469 RepID=UPI0005751F35|nr:MULTISPECIES: hypothetical protein [Acinetobacter]KHO16823.1 hypothetical protein NT90_03120 [Acinetobacter baumannii]MBJ8505508.1 hypothetical protein [Acinetobacter seifertii]MEB3794491.1 hypothetical protein [Acinetobacter sp. IK24]MEB3813613.1 hypothetical protein [Acinetobacter sp. IK22]MEB3832722.1 hypothetical protein [Acinetobacter sp. IK23]
MPREYKYYQVDSTHYNLEQVVKFTTSSDLSSVLVRFADGSDVEFTFENEDEYSEFLQVIRGVDF